MRSFEFYFGIYLGEMILRHSDSLSRTLQKKVLSAVEGQHIAGLVKATLQSMCSTDQFDLFGKFLQGRLRN